MHEKLRLHMKRFTVSPSFFCPLVLTHKGA